MRGCYPQEMNVTATTTPVLPRLTYLANYYDKLETETQILIVKIFHSSCEYFLPD